MAAQLHRPATQEVDDAMEVDGVQQPKDKAETRRATRLQYRRLQEDLNENRAGYVNDVSRLMPKIEDLNRIYANVDSTRESALDSQILLHATQIVHEKIQTLNVGRALFDSANFMNRLLNHVAEHGNSGDPLADVGMTYGAFIHRAPIVEFMLGPMDVKVKERHVAVRQQREVVEKRILEAREISEHLRETATTDSSQTPQFVKQVYQVLSEALRDRESVPLFEFVVNPLSFAQTIENLFYVSFLVKDRRVAVEVDEQTGELGIYVVAKEEVMSSEDAQRVQWIPSLAMDEWRALAEAYELTEPKYLKDRNYH
ncbi:nuclear protein [Allomyces javanicus]|nr:nuclear protein [Allomyces javanicus]